MLKNENRPGYKKTTLGQLVTFSSGGTPPKAKTSFWGGTHPWVSAKDMKCPVIYDSLDTLTDAGFEVANIAPKNALLILVRGMTLYKKVPVCLASKDMAFNQDLKALVPSKEVLPNFLLYYLLANESELLGLVDSAGHGTGRLNTDLLRNLPVYLPPLPEQSAIAEVLECWDKAIQTLTLKIDKKRQTQKRLMNQLLSGEQRLPGYSKRWKDVMLGKLGEFSKGAGISKEELSPKGIPCIRYGEIYTVHNFVLKEFHSFISLALAAISARIRKNDLLFAGSGETAEEIGKSVAYMGEAEAYAGGDVIILSVNPAKGRADYISYYLNTIGRRELNKLGQGQSVVHIYPKNLAKVSLVLPPLDEQHAIASVLSASGKEIDALNRKLTLLNDQKMFLLNNLVTGTIRLPQFCKAARKGDRHE